MVCRTACLALLISMPPAVAAADEIVIPLPEGVAVDTVTVDYSCDGLEMPVRYINAGSVSLAVLEIDGEFVVASLTLAASGARYAANKYVWWSKGDSADLYDLMEGEDAPPVLGCTAARP